MPILNSRTNPALLPIILALFLLTPTQAFTEPPNSAKLSSQTKVLLQHYQAAVKTEDKAALLALFHAKAFDCITEKNESFNDKEEILAHHFALSKLVLEKTRTIPYKDVESLLQSILSEKNPLLPEISVEDLSFTASPSEQVVLYWKEPEVQKGNEGSETLKQTRLLVTKENNEAKLTHMCISERFHNFQNSLKGYTDKASDALKRYNALSIETKKKLLLGVDPKDASLVTVLKKRLSEELQTEDEFILDLLATRLWGDFLTGTVKP